MARITSFENLKTLFELARLRNCIIGFLGILVAVLFLDSDILSESTILAGFSLILIISAGNMINDYFDFQVDKINRADRPIPSGRIKRSNVLILSLLFFVFGIAIAFFINLYCFILSIVNSIFLVFYGKFSKKLLFVSNLGIAYLIASLFIFGAFSAGLSSFGEKTTLLSILTASAFLMTLSREIIKDIEDMEGDKKSGSVSIPIKFGPTIAKNLAVIFAVFAIVVSFLPFFLAVGKFNLYIYSFLISVSDVIFLVSLKMKPEKTQRMMALGMFLALIAFFIGKFAA